MSMTIKALADELGVSKTAIRNHMDAEFRAKYTAKDSKGVITVTPEGCKVISEKLNKTPESTAKNEPETELLTVPRSVWLALERQLQEKDDQLKAKDKQIEDLTAAIRAQAQGVTQAQALHAGTMQQQLTAGTAETEVVAEAASPQKK